MSGIDIAVIVIVCVISVAVVGYLIYAKVKHKGGCCDCGGNCATCAGCKTAGERDKNSGTAQSGAQSVNDAGNCPHCGKDKQ